MIINSHILERIICDPVIVFVVKIPLHFYYEHFAFVLQNFVKHEPFCLNAST